MSETHEEVAIEEVEEEVQMSVLDALKEVSGCFDYHCMQAKPFGVFQSFLLLISLSLSLSHTHTLFLMYNHSNAGTQEGSHS
jgi:hypothetical protein